MGVLLRYGFKLFNLLTYLLEDIPKQLFTSVQLKCHNSLFLSNSVLVLSIYLSSYIYIKL